MKRIILSLIVASIISQSAVADDIEAKYQKSCALCHGAGIAGAPKVGDKEAWAPRIAKGNDVLLEHAKAGFNAMPPRGTCADCSDDDLKTLIKKISGQ